jgi:hypothetical protein
MHFRSGTEMFFDSVPCNRSGRRHLRRAIEIAQAAIKHFRVIVGQAKTGIDFFHIVRGGFRVIKGFRDIGVKLAENRCGSSSPI